MAKDLRESEQQQDAIAAIGTILNSQEVKVLGAIGLFVGYLCVLLTKLMNFTEPYVGVIGVVSLTLLLLALSNPIAPKSPVWWFRAAAVIVLAIILTSPQLYFAWTVSVAEVRANALQSQHQEAKQLTNKFIEPVVTIGEPKPRSGP